MYAQLVIIALGPGMRPTAEKLADQFAPVVKAQKGFKSTCVNQLLISFSVAS